jgi:hypothetical protein
MTLTLEETEDFCMNISTTCLQDFYRRHHTLKAWERWA